MDEWATKKIKSIPTHTRFKNSPVYIANTDNADQFAFVSNGDSSKAF